MCFGKVKRSYLLVLGPSDQTQIVSLDINKFPSEHELEMKLTV